MPSEIQAILFNKKQYNLLGSYLWLIKHKFIKSPYDFIKIDDTKKKYRYRFYNPDNFKYFRTKKLKNYEGIEFLFGFY